jgi:hypothetical protein
MDVPHLILALGADLTDHLHLLNAGFDALEGPFPGVMPIPIYVALKFICGKEDTSESYDVRCDIISPDGSRVATQGEKIVIGIKAASDLPRSHDSLLTFLGVLVPQLGLYEVRLVVNGDLLKTIPLHIGKSPKRNPS